LVGETPDITPFRHVARSLYPVNVPHRQDSPEGVLSDARLLEVSCGISACGNCRNIFFLPQCVREAFLGISPP
jgi:hypothetical protein